MVDLFVRIKCVRAFYEWGSSWRLHSALWWSSLSQGSRQETFLCELFFCTAEACHWLEPCSLWEKSQRAQDGIFIFYFVLLHLYSIDICNGWNINVSDVPVNVNKIKPILKGTRFWVVWWRVQCRWATKIENQRHKWRCNATTENR